MTFARELDSVPWEARKSVATTFTFWPKVNGVNVQAEAFPTFVSVFEVYDPDGTQIQAGSPTLTTTGTPSHSSLACPLSAISTLGEGYTLRITWAVVGETFSRLDVRTFDVVLVTFDQPTTSLNDLREERPDVDVVLDRLGQRLGYTAGETAQAAMAGIYAVRGLLALQGMLRTTVANDAKGAVATYTGLTRTDARYTRPHLILDRQRLNRVERLLALREIFRGIASDPDEGDDENSALYRHYNREAAAVFEQLGPLAYDADENLVPETQVVPTRRAIFMRRVQG